MLNLNIGKVHDNVKIKGNGNMSNSKASGLCGVILRVKATTEAIPYSGTLGLCMFRVFKNTNGSLIYKDFSLYGGETSASDTTVIASLKDNNPEVTDIICYTDIKADGYIYVYLRSTGDLKAYSVQMLYAPFITAYDTIYDISFDKYPADFTSIGNVKSYKPTLNWSEYASYMNVYDLKGEIFAIDCLLYKTALTSIPDGTTIFTTSYIPTVQFSIPAVIGSTTYNKAYPCLLTLDTSGNLKIYGVSTLTSTDLSAITINIEFKYKTSVLN